MAVGPKGPSTGRGRSTLRQAVCTGNLFRDRDATPWPLTTFLVAIRRDGIADASLVNDQFYDIKIKTHKCLIIIYFSSLQ